MARETLQRASELLKQAAEATTGDRRERLYRQSDEFAKHATADHGPDHGRLARHERILKQLRDGASDDVAEHVDAALENVREYRSTVEGV